MTDTSLRERVARAIRACHLDNVLLDDECVELTDALLAELADVVSPP